MWKPWLAGSPGPLYRRVALALQEDISAGRLPAGARLPTHRELARALKTTVVTASRAYREAADRGLVRGDVGRGTFVALAAGGHWRSFLGAAAAVGTLVLLSLGLFVIGALQNRRGAVDGNR